MNKKRTITLAFAALFVVSVFTSTVLAYEPPPPGDEGCTPGYWKNLRKHRDDWVGFAPTDSFSDVFGVGPDRPLRRVLRTGGGGYRALYRHAVAALLNAANPNVNYAYTVQQVISMVDTDDPETIKDQLEAENEQGCPLPLPRSVQPPKP